jgi:adenine-specific DNA-methyltransferase
MSENEQTTNGLPQSTYVSKTTPDLAREQIEQLRRIFPECVTEGQVDWERLRATLGEADALAGNDAYTFSWAGKQEAFRAIQTPSAASLEPAPDESLNWDTTQNLFVEGENLEVLKLLYKSYFGKVKLIYIDPPYNTGHDFIYKDDYRQPRRAYLEKTGQVDAEGNTLTSNPETNGRYHSDWLTMMYPRLFLARQLLREDGVIFVSIDDNEVHHLRLLMNELFGEENFIAQLIWKSRQFTDTRAVTNISTDHEYMLVYGRRSDVGFRGVERDESKFSNPDNDPRGYWMSRSILGLATIEQRPNLHYEIIDPETDTTYSPPTNTGWRYSRERMQSLIEDGCILFPSDPGGRPREKKFRADLLSEYISFPSITDDVFTANGTAEIRELFDFQVFDFPKPSTLIQRLVEQMATEDDLVLDFFAGSCTIAQAVFQQNRLDGEQRRFICVQLPESLDEQSEVAKRGFYTIADIGKERIRRVIAQMQAEREGQLPLETRETPEDLGFKVFKLAPSTFRQWESPEEESDEALARQLSFFDGGLETGSDPMHVIYEVVLKEGYDLNARIEPLAVESNQVYRVSQAEGQGENGARSFFVCLDNAIAGDTLDALALDKESAFVCLDTALDDSTKVNLALQCVLKTI